MIPSDKDRVNERLESRSEEREIIVELYRINIYVFIFIFHPLTILR